MALTHEGAFLSFWEKGFDLIKQREYNKPAIVAHLAGDPHATYEDITCAESVWYTHPNGVDLSANEMNWQNQLHLATGVKRSFDAYMIENGYLRLPEYLYQGVNAVIVKIKGPLTLLETIDALPDHAALWIEEL